MSQRSSVIKPFIEDLEQTAAHILEFIAETSEADFYNDVMMQWSVIRGLEVLGEASKQLLNTLPDAQVRFPNIPFKRMYATRNRLIHGYSTIEMSIIWRIVQIQIPAVHLAAKDALANWPSDLA
jgi:uncharacterized protein with HEPN domain